MPPLHIQLKFSVKAKRVITSPETAKHIDHPPQKGTTQPDNFRSMMEMADQRLKLASVAPPSVLPRLNQLL